MFPKIFAAFKAMCFLKQNGLLHSIFLILYNMAYCSRCYLWPICAKPLPMVCVLATFIFSSWKWFLGGLMFLFLFLQWVVQTGRMMLAASISTSVVFVSLATFTFSASKKGNNLSSPGKFLLSNYTITVAVIAGFIQVSFPTSNFIWLWTFRI